MATNTPFPLSQQGAGRTYTGQTGTFQNRPIAYYNNTPSGGHHIAPTDNITGWSALEHAWERAGMPGYGYGGAGGTGVRPPGSPPGPSPGAGGVPPRPNPPSGTVPAVPGGPGVPATPAIPDNRVWASGWAPGAGNQMQGAPWVPPGFRTAEPLPASWTGMWDPATVNNAANRQVAAFNNPAGLMIGGQR